MLRKKILALFQIILSFIGFTTVLVVTSFIYKPLASEYLNFPRPVGGDYYNGLTYAVHFAKHLPLPPTGWLSFWHEGIPVIGGYAVTAFYLMSPLFKWFDAATAMEIFSAAALLMFFLTAGVLFRMLTRSTPAAIFLTILTLTTKASFYQIFNEGFVTASAMQWTLPLSIIVLYKYLETKKNNFLVAGGAVLGVAVLLHPAMGLLTVVIPTVTWLSIYFLTHKQFKNLVTSWITIMVFVLCVGGPTLYMLVKFTLQSSGSGACTNAQCWGQYPQHLYLWFNTFIPSLLVILLALAIAIKLLKKPISLSPIFALLISAGVLILYVALAYFHLIDSFAGGIFPRRVFWAINLLLLVAVAMTFRALTKLLGKLTNYTLSIILMLLLVIIYKEWPYLTVLDTSFMFADPGAIPSNIHEYIVPKYQKADAAQFLPEWVLAKSRDANFRFDSLNNQVYQWWNTFAATPATRGYSNSPSGVNASWLYYFQVGTAENPPSLPRELIRNRTLFLLDHYGVGLYEDSGRAGTKNSAGYAPELLTDANLVTRKESVRELIFYELSDQVVTPVISPTNAIPFLIVSDAAGYETIVRAFSYTGLPSNTILPIKGPESIDSITDEQLNTFPLIFLYQFRGTNWNKLHSFLQTGGRLIVELGSLKKLPVLPDFFPTDSFSLLQVKSQLNFTTNDSPLLQDVNPSQFSPFVYNGGNWNLWVPGENFKSVPTNILTAREGQLFFSSPVNHGTVYVSGMNLPFHIVDTQNFDEVKFFKNIFSEIFPNHPDAPNIGSLQRPVPEKIEVTGQFRGVYFKENFDAGWQAYVNNLPMRIYPAGPQFMYIPTASLNSSSSVVVQYRGTPTTWILFALSLAFLIFSILFFIFPRQISYLFQPLISILKKPLTRMQTAEHENY